MSEQRTPLLDQLAGYDLEGRNLAAWHQWLTTDRHSGEPTGHLACPGSRYGRIGADCAWYALGCEVVAVEANGPSDDPEAALEYYMTLTVNDHASIGELLVEYWCCLPDALAAMIGERVDVVRLIQ